MAELQDVPPYIIFADTSLKQMAAKKPSSKEEMLKITGVGEYKLKKYGDIFLREIGRYCEEQEGHSSDICSIADSAGMSPHEPTCKMRSETLPTEPRKKRERIIETIKGLDRELVILTKAKLGDAFSEEEIRDVWSDMLSGYKQT
jgi:ATP-dependent DNA helicase RecQ